MMEIKKAIDLIWDIASDIDRTDNYPKGCFDAIRRICVKATSHVLDGEDNENKTKSNT